MKKQVLINFDIEGYHCYPNAPERVHFLSFPHRHLFKIKAGFNVIDLDREIEIFTVEKEIVSFLQHRFGDACDFRELSCEMIAMLILKNQQHNNCVWVEVLEDGRGGARIEL